MSESAKTNPAKSADAKGAEAKGSEAKGAAPEAGQGPTAADVAKYLREHPDFFVRHVKLLKAMTPPKRWTGDGVVDMQKFMIDDLRNEITGLRRDASEMIETTRSNMSNQARVHAAVLTLIEADDFERLTHAIGDDLRLVLDVDAVSVGFAPPAADETQPPLGPHLRTLKPGTLEKLFPGDRRAVLLADVHDDGEMFGAAAGLVHSAALARLSLGKGTPPGLLALGSRTDAFQPGQGTELVVFLARVIETCLKRCLQGEPGEG